MLSRLSILIGVLVQLTLSSMVVLDLTSYPEKEYAQKVKIEVGDCLEVHMRSNPSTGYSWTIIEKDL